MIRSSFALTFIFVLSAAHPTFAQAEQPKSSKAKQADRASDLEAVRAAYVAERTELLSKLGSAPSLDEINDLNRRTMELLGIETNQMMAGMWGCPEMVLTGYVIRPDAGNVYEFQHDKHAGGGNAFIRTAGTRFSGPGEFRMCARLKTTKRKVRLASGRVAVYRVYVEDARARAAIR